jgi:hypothetical protein
VAIGRWLHERYGARPWRFDAAAYRAAVAVSRTRLPPLKRPRQSSVHDDGLVVELTRLGVVVSEEAVLDQLVSDLAAGRPGVG